MIKCYKCIICKEVLTIKTYVVNDFGCFCKLEAKKGNVTNSQTPFAMGNSSTPLIITLIYRRGRFQHQFPTE